MSELTYIIFLTLVGSIFSLLGGILLLLKQKFALKVSHLLSAFAAGTLLGTAFFDLLPEAHHLSEEMGKEFNFGWVLGGVLAFFLMERSIHWFHHTHVRHDHDERQTVPLIIFGDSIHNFIDGVIIAVSVMVNPALGLVTALAVATHEIPQEIGDFGILLKKGMKAVRVFWVNILSAGVAIFGAILAFALGQRIEGFLPALLSVTSGFFIYIALSDLIPDIHNENRRGFALYETVLLILGVITIWLLVSLLHGAH